MNDEPTLILTPTARLARAEKQRMARVHQEAGESAWLQPTVLAFPSWINQLRDDWFLVGDDSRVPVTSAQALVLWQAVIDHDIFIGEPRVAEMAASAWRLLHEHQLKAPDKWPDLILSEDSRRFRDWAGRFRALCDERGLIEEWTFAASLPELIASGRIELPPTIRLSGFELPMTPLQRTIVDAAETAGSRIERDKPDHATAQWGEVIELTDGDEEIRAAASWARARLEDHPDQSIAIVVPGLRDRLSRFECIFRKVFDPAGFALEPTGHEPWHVSLGPALASWPLVADALQWLRLDPHRITQPEAASMLRSAFLAGADEERLTRARTLAELIGRKPYWMHAGQIAWQAGRCGAGRLQQRLADWEALRREHRDAAPPSTWVARLQKELDAIGFGRGRSLDSREFQVLQRFHDLLEEFSALDLVIERPISRAEAVRRLNERASTAAFRERNPGAPVEILGIEEALGSRFDALWITALDNQTWPSAARRDPFIPAPIQEPVPAATVEGALARARAELDGLLAAAPEVRGSFARGADDDQHTLTPLLGEHQPIKADPADPPESAPMDAVPGDIQAPPLEGGDVRGGTGVLQSQSNCPFRAFAEWRLGAGDLTPPRPGLDARDRGSLVHKALEHFWQDLEGLAALQAMDKKALASRIDDACRFALDGFVKHSPLALSESGLELEAQCLKRSLELWLALETQRGNFRIKALEDRIELRFGPLTLTGKIDRIDEIEGGGSVVIDYKTGASGKNGWAPEERPVDVQLPAYAAGLSPRPIGIAFARLRPDSMGFDGLAEVDVGTPGVEVIGEIKRSKFREIESWPSLVKDWRQSLVHLAEDFASGRAEVDPRDNQVCRYCHLHGLCRIDERVILPEADNE